MREGRFDLKTLIGVCQFMASNLVRLQDLFGFIFWFYLLFLSGKNNLKCRAVIQWFFALISCINVYHIYRPILAGWDNFESNGITFLAVLVLADVYTFILELISFERIQVVIKTLVVVLCTFILVSSYVACFAYFKSCMIKWVVNGPLNLTGNVIYCRGNNSYIPGDKMIEMSDHDLSFTVTSYIFDVESHVMPIYSERQFFYKDIQNTHVKKIAMKRYIGEAARLECEFKVGVEIFEYIYLIRPFISKNRLDIQNSYRHTIQTLYLNKSESLVYTIALDISPLAKEDFGIYRAGIRAYLDSGENILLTSAHQLYHQIEYYLCVFSVSQIDEYYTYNDVPVGGLLHFRDLFLTAVSNSSKVRVEHIVNGVKIDLVPEITSKCCLNSLQSATGTTSNMKLLKHLHYSSNTVDIFEIVATICVCPSLFGIHRIKLIHDLYDPEEQQWKTLEFMHPQITVVYPTSPALSWIHIYEQEINLIEISKEEKEFSLFNGSMFQYLQNTKHIEFCVINTLEDIILIVSAILFLTVMYWSLIVCLYILNVVIMLILTNETSFQQERGQYCQQIHGRSNENLVLTCNTNITMYEYDAFISYVEEDIQFVMETLQPILSQHRLRVFLGDDDLPPGPRLDNSLTVIKQTKIVLIVISNEYLTDQFYNYFFPNIVFPSLHDGSISCETIVLIRYKPCNIPNTWFTQDKIILYDT
ncbi:hypothetical protein ACJMK2_000651 [Sinanodonta woodiana]|uniref:TIR domain-containing protein n=1 Tax=Sinanodonta woodiana TaxID=1069815 RepID=A0ABD3XTF1_SINWO